MSFRFFLFFIILGFSFKSFTQTSFKRSSVSPENKKLVSPSVNVLSEYFLKLIDTETLMNFDIKSIKTKFSTWIIFQKGCESCHLMMKDANCFRSKVNTINFLGLLSKPEILLKEARIYNKLDRILYTSHDLESSLNLSVTPTVFIFEGEKLIHRHNNYMKCKAIKKFLK